MCGQNSVEMDQAARRVVEAAFPDSEFVEDVAESEVDEAKVQEWAAKYSGAAMFSLALDPLPRVFQVYLKNPTTHIGHHLLQTRML